MERDGGVSQFGHFQKEKGMDKAKATAMPHKEKQDIDKKLSHAIRLKAEFLVVTSAAIEPLAAIDRSGQWSWGNNEQNQGYLGQVLLSMQASSTTDLRKVLLTHAGSSKRSWGRAPKSDDSTEVEGAPHGARPGLSQ